MDEYGIMINVVLIVVLSISLVADLVFAKIYNWVTLPAIIAGLSLNLIYNGWQGLLFSFIGLIVGLVVLFIPFLLGGMGAGDVKLMGAVGAILGYPVILWIAIYTALVGGAMALIKLVLKEGLVRRVKIMFRIAMSYVIPGMKPVPINHDEAETIPYGVAIVAGTLIALYLGSPF